jgi:uncharacterized protein YihD (DUF1040 family)
MTVIGFSSGVVCRDGNVDRLVKAVLQKSGHEYEFVKLTGTVITVQTLIPLADAKKRFPAIVKDVDENFDRFTITKEWRQQGRHHQ